MSQARLLTEERLKPGTRLYGAAGSAGPVPTTCAGDIKNTLNGMDPLSRCSLQRCFLVGKPYYMPLTTLLKGTVQNGPVRTLVAQVSASGPPEWYWCGSKLDGAGG